MTHQIPDGAAFRHQNASVAAGWERLFARSRDPIGVLDREGRLVRANPALESLLAERPQPLEGADFLSLIDPREKAEARRALEALEDGTETDFEARLAGRPQWLAWRASLDGPTGLVFLLGEDCTERVRLRESEALLATLIEALPDAINFKDGHGRWLLANEAMLRAFHIVGVDYRGKRDTELTPYSPFFGECFAFCEVTDEKSWQHGTISLAEEEIPQPEGPPLVFETYKVPLFHPDGSRKGLVVIGRDISERKRLEAERAELAMREQAALAEVRAARELDALKSAFVNAVSHELRTPLTSIRGYAEFLLDELGGTLTPEQKEFSEQIERGAKRLERLIDDLLDFARLEAGTFELKRQELRLGPLVQGVLDSLLPQARESEIELEAELPDDMPTISGDPHRLEQVLGNLLSNALKFTPAGGHVAVRARREDGGLTCEVIDTGPGIAPEDIARLFQRFSQLEAGKAHRGGTGLGLSIAKSIVEAHGGHIGVHSTPGKGSTFWFSLPGR